MELWHLILLLIAFFGCIGAFGKILLDQVEKRQAERFTALDKSREEGQKALRETFDKHIAEERLNGLALANLEKDFLKWQANLPLNYVRREDYVRGQSVIEAKLDALYNKLEVVQLRGAQNANA
jgi:hypothetical protein